MTTSCQLKMTPRDGMTFGTATLEWGSCASLKADLRA